MYDTIRYDTVYLTCSKKLTDSQFSLPHGTNKNVINYLLCFVDSCDLGAFYRHVNKRIANRSGTGAIVADDDKLLLDDADKANAFNRYFSSMLSITMLHRTVKACLYLSA